MPKNSINIRLFKPSDIQEIITLFRDAVHTININDYSPEQVAIWAPEEVDVARWQEKLMEHITYVAEIDSIIVGFADISREGYFDHLYVHKDYTGGRVAYRLFKQIEQTARDLGLTKITTDCSITAKKPAERMGFVVIKEQTVQRNGVSFINYAMEKKLS